MLDLERQYAPLREELLEALAGVLDSRQFILGNAVEGFEKAAAADALGVAHAVGCSSGTDALWLALAAAGIGPGSGGGDHPFSFFASVSAILRAGADAVLADIDPSTFNLDPRAVEAALDAPRGTSVRAILPVHLYGQPVDWDEFAGSGRERGLTLVEDAAQAWGAEWRGTKAGRTGDAAAFSFYPTKNLSAAGDAGMVTTNSDEIAERLRMLRQHGMRRRYYHDEVGWNARMDGFQGAVLRVKLKYIAGWNRSGAGPWRSDMTAMFRAAGLAERGSISRAWIVLPHEAEGSTHVWHQYVIRSCAARCVAGVPDQPRNRQRDLLSRAAASCRTR